MPTFTFNGSSAGASSDENGASRPPRKSFAPIPENEIVVAEIKEVTLEEKPVAWRNGPDDTHVVSWHFVVTEGQHEKRHLWGKTPTWFNPSPKCRLRLWAQESLGLDFWPEGKDLQTDELQGRQVRLLVGNRAKQDNTITDYVKDVLRLRPGAPASVYQEDSTASELQWRN